MSGSVAAWLERIERLHPANIELGLDRVAEVWSRHGCAKPAPIVLTVAGTNGKGSTVAMLEQILATAGFSTACYTSPHLHRYNERIRIRQENISDQRLLMAFEGVEALRDATPLTYFEFGTLTALWAIQQSQVDVAVLEVGLGGRLDATNIIDADAAIVTAIGLDHTDWLGEDLAQIGREKAGIFRSGAIAVGSSPTLPTSIRDQADLVEAVYSERGAEFAVHKDQGGWQLVTLTLELSDLSPPALAGSHQIDNAAGAIVALEQLGLLPSRGAVNQALETVQLSGRLQRLGNAPTVLLDVAHNPDGAARIRDHLQAHRAKPQSNSAQTIHAVVGMLNDKDVVGFCATLEEAGVGRWYLASLPGARGAPASHLQDLLGSRPSALFDNVAAALTAAIDQANPDDIVVVTGSFVTVSEALTELGRPS